MAGRSFVVGDAIDLGWKLLRIAREIDGAKMRFGCSLLEEYSVVMPGSMRVLMADLKQELRRFSARFAQQTKRPLRTLAQIEALLHVEDAIRVGKETGMRRMPLATFDHNRAWLEVSLLARVR